MQSPLGGAHVALDTASLRAAVRGQPPAHRGAAMASSPASSSERASKPLASALGNSLAVLLEESMAPLRLRLAALEEQSAEQRTAQGDLLVRVVALEEEQEALDVQTKAALSVQTKAIDESLPRLGQAEERLAALTAEFKLEFDATHGKHTEHVENTETALQRLEETLANAEARQSETFSELQDHQREAAAVHATHAEAIEAHRLEMLEHHANLESHRGEHEQALATHADSHMEAIEALQHSHREMLESHKDHHSDLVESVRRDHEQSLEEHRTGHSEVLQEHKSAITESLAVRAQPLRLALLRPVASCCWCGCC